MIKLTKLNGEIFILNSGQIQSIEIIPESKVILMNKEFFVVTETADEIIEKVTSFNARVWGEHQKITVEKM